MMCKENSPAGKGETMGYTNVALKDKITEMYPEIREIRHRCQP